MWKLLEKPDVDHTVNVPFGNWWNFEEKASNAHVTQENLASAKEARYTDNNGFILIDGRCAIFV